MSFKTVSKSGKWQIWNASELFSLDYIRWLFMVSRLYVKEQRNYFSEIIQFRLIVIRYSLFWLVVNSLRKQIII